jgi:pimeloyl-ACP methyl ester carboxylesterase
MPQLPTAIAALALLALASLAPPVLADDAPARSSQPPLTLRPCLLEHPSHIAAVEADCGTLSVPENPDAPRGRHIALYVARIPAINRNAKLDPLFLLAGGPGMAATTFYVAAASAFAPIHVDRDIVLVDQRGTGRSNGLACKVADDAEYRATEAALESETRECLATLSRHADVAYYTTSLAVRDLDRVRDALGYARIDLYGGSYGTRVAEQYLRRFPEHSRAVILDGVVPPDEPLGATLALDAERSLESILARCARESACRATFGDPALAYHALLDSLSGTPVTVQLTNPKTGAPMSLAFSRLHLAAVLRLSSYTSEQAALLPLSLYLAHDRGNFAPLASQYLLVTPAYEDVIAYGMHNTVVCTEDVRFYARANIDRSRLEKTYLGTIVVDELEKVCAHWPRGPIDADLHAPLVSAVPVLLMSGEDDPVTPPAFADRAARGLSDSAHVVLKGRGHGQITAPCVPRLMQQFLDRGTTRGLDVSCTGRAGPFPFFTSIAGPPP